VMTMSSGMEDVLARFGRAWGWIVAYGVASVVAGIVAVIYPGATLIVIAVIFAIQLVLAAIYQFVFAFAIPREVGWLRAITALLAALSLVVGLYLIGHVGLTLIILAALLGIYWIAAGVIELFVGFGHPELSGRAWTILSGVLSIIAGGVVVIYPGASLVFLTLVLGFWLIIFGVTLVARGVQLRSFAQRVGATGPKALA
jgi:uncharacterized membrane protein HdeD (DUF308 family)